MDIREVIMNGKDQRRLYKTMTHTGGNINER